MMIPFNKPHIAGNEFTYIERAINNGKLSGGGEFTDRVQEYFTDRFKFPKVLLTTSCTDALEMSAILARIKPGDEVIMPSFTFVSTANAFVLRGANIRFIDSTPDHPNIDPCEIHNVINEKTRALVAVHYAGVACDMDRLIEYTSERNVLIIEDAAQAIDSYYKSRPLGGIGHFGTFSFHETKNIGCGEGGMIVINDEEYYKRAEIIWEKGTNRSAFFRGEVDKYGWVDVGSSFLPSEITASFLYAQTEKIDEILNKRRSLWNRYQDGLMHLEDLEVSLPSMPDYATNNGHIFYLLLRTEQERDDLIRFLRNKGVHAVFHYQPLHKSSYYKDFHDGRELPMAEKFATRLVRLPLYYDLSINEQDYIIDSIGQYFSVSL
jgi:dTDP-4-amino-4,6-dideoxygalactose transaminase